MTIGSRTPVVGLLLLAATFGSGCATIAHGWKQDVMVLSEPMGASVFVGDKRVGITPVRLTLQRRTRAVLRFEKEGFAATEVPLKRSVDGWVGVDVAVALNPMAGQGLDSTSQWPAMAATALGELLAIDFLTGAAFKLPKTVRAILTKAPAPAASPGTWNHEDR